jgi:hypothetical protein
VPMGTASAAIVGAGVALDPSADDVARSWTMSTTRPTVIATVLAKATPSTTADLDHALMADIPRRDSRGSQLDHSSLNRTRRNVRKSATSYTALSAPAMRNGSPAAIPIDSEASAGPNGLTMWRAAFV